MNAERTRPNILFLLADQWRSDCLSITGHPVVETPNLDMIARQGVVFTNAYSPCPSCVAARASLFTGLSPDGTGRLGYQDRVPWRYEDTLAQLVGDAGYQTHCVGKTHFFPQRNHFGFDSIESYEGLQNFDGKYVNDYFEWLEKESNGKYHEEDSGLAHNSWVARPSHLPEELHNNTWVATRGIEYLRRRDPTRPFFLNLSFHRPHPPIDPPEVFWNEYIDRPLPPVPVGEWAADHSVIMDDVNGWHGVLPSRTLDRTRRGYFAQIAHIDNQIGRVLHYLARAKAGPTAIVFTADHGEMLGDHNLFRKSYAYEGSAGVPMILMVPDVRSDMRSDARGDAHSDTNLSCACDAPAVLQDVYTTILEIAGVKAPDRTEGVSLLPALRPGSSTAELFNRTYIQGEHSSCYDEANAMQFLTDGKEKYIWFPVSGREQLFDIANDPNELHDLAGETAHAGDLAIWRSRLVELLARRPQDGLSDGTKLIAGKSPPAVRAEMVNRT